VHDRGVRAVGVAAAVPAVAEDGEPGDVDVHSFRHVDVDVGERGQDRDYRPLLVDGGVAQVEVEVGEGTGGHGPPAQPETPAPRDMTEHGYGEPGRLAARAGRPQHGLGQVLLDLRELLPELGAQGGLDPLGELLQRQAPGEKMLPERGDGLLPVSVRGPQGGVVHSRHCKPPMRRAE
jgi:hypothetical protein